MTDKEGSDIVHGLDFLSEEDQTVLASACL